MNDILIVARALATFANLEPSSVEEFRNSVYPDFVPPVLWQMRESEADEPPVEAWKRIRNKVRDAWKAGFPLDDSIDLIALIVLYSRVGHAMEEDEERILRPKSWPFQRAVMFLAANNSWRARFCQRCAKCFVATEPRSTFCSDVCFRESRKITKRGWWSEHGQQWRDKKASKTKAGAKKGRK